jgi:hypothetical protein
MCAQSLHHAKDYLGEFFRRITRKLGRPQAITATAHKLARIFFHLLTTKEATTRMPSIKQKTKPFAAHNIVFGEKLPNLVFKSSPRRTGDVPWESALQTEISRPVPGQALCGAIGAFVTDPKCGSRLPLARS